MRKALSLRRGKAFTLLELIVVIVILGILAALAIPTFMRVIEKSKDAAAGVSLSSIARNAQAISAFSPDTNFEFTDIEKAVSETSGKALDAGVYAASLEFTLAPGSEAVVPGGETLSTKYAEVGIAYGAEYSILGLAMKSTSDRCVYTKAMPSGSTIWAVSEAKLDSCDPKIALALTGDDGEVVGGGPGSGPPADQIDFQTRLQASSDTWEGRRSETATIYSEPLPAGVTSWDASCEVDVPLPAPIVEKSGSSVEGESLSIQLYPDTEESIPAPATPRTYTCTLVGYNNNNSVVHNSTLSAVVDGEVAGPPSLPAPAFETFTVTPGVGELTSNWTLNLPAEDILSIYTSPTLGEYALSGCSPSSIQGGAENCTFAAEAGVEYAVYINAVLSFKYGNAVISAGPILATALGAGGSEGSWDSPQMLPVTNGTPIAQGSMTRLGNNMFVGDPGDDDMASNAGSVSVYTLLNGSWFKTSEIYSDAPHANARFGSHVEAADGTLMVGSPEGIAGYNGSFAWAGAIYAFEDVDGAWTLYDTISPHEGMAYYFNGGNSFGSTFEFDGTTLAGLSFYGPPSDVDKDTIFTFSKTGDTWSQDGAIMDPSSSETTAFGEKISLDGTTLAVSARHYVRAGESSSVGAVYIYEKSGGNWNAPALLENPGDADTQFGIRMDAKEGTVFIGANGGSVLAYNKSNGSWVMTENTGTSVNGDILALSSDSFALKSSAGNRATIWSGHDALDSRAGATIDLGPESATGYKWYYSGGSILASVNNGIYSISKG